MKLLALLSEEALACLAWQEFRTRPAAYSSVNPRRIKA